jgi:hypothetical protein
MCLKNQEKSSKTALAIAFQDISGILPPGVVTSSTQKKKIFDKNKKEL